MKREMTHDEYEEYLKANADRLYTDPNYKLADYERDADNVVITGFGLEKFNLPEALEKAANAYFSTMCSLDSGSIRLEGFMTNSQMYFSLAMRFGCSYVDGDGLRGFFRNDQDKCIFDYCEGDISLTLCETEQAYQEELRKTYDFFKGEMPKEKEPLSNKIENSLGRKDDAKEVSAKDKER